MRLVNEEMDSVSREYQQELDIVVEEIQDVNRRLGRHYDAIESGKLSFEDLAPRIKELKGRKESLEARKWELEWHIKARKVELADAETVRRYVQDLRNLLNNSPLVERKSFIKSFVKEVRVTGNQAELIYTIPMPPKELINEVVPVLSIIQYGGLGRIRTYDQPVMSRPLCR